MDIEDVKIIKTSVSGLDRFGLIPKSDHGHKHKHESMPDLGNKLLWA